MTYWAKRWERLKLDAMDRADLTIDELEQIYYESLMKLQADVESWYHRYARENHLTLSEARKQLNARELKAFKITLKEYQEQAQQANLSDAHKRMLANASIRVRLDRAQQLYIQVVHHTAMLAQGKNERMEKLLVDVYESNTYKTAYETQTMKSVYKDVHLVPEDAIRTAISKPWAPDGVDFSSRIWKDRDVLVNSLQSEITRSLIIGEGSGKLAERIADKYNVSFKNARRLAETETAYVQELSSYEQYKDNDIEQYQILATLDSRTSETCRHLDGKIIDMKDYKIGVTAPPFHCHCRTTTIPYIEGITDDGGRAYRDENGKTAYTDEYMTYEEWYNKYVRNTDADTLINLVAKNGLTIKGISQHQQERVDARNLDIEGVKNALIDPLHIDDVRIDSKGRPSIRFIGNTTTVNVNPDTGVICTSWQTGSKIKKKYQKDGDNNE